MGLELTTPRSRVTCCSDQAIQAPGTLYFGCYCEWNFSSLPYAHIQWNFLTASYWLIGNLFFFSYQQLCDWILLLILNFSVACPRTSRQAEIFFANTSWNLEKMSLCPCLTDKMNLSTFNIKEPWPILKSMTYLFKLYNSYLGTSHNSSVCTYF